MKARGRDGARHSGFLKNVAVMSGGTVLSQGILIMASPILTRLYTPAEFGVVAVLTSVLSLVVVAASLRYEAAIPLPESDDDGMALLLISLGLVVLSSVLIAVIVLAEAPRLSIWLGVPAVAGFAWLVPIGVLGIGSYQALNYWSSRKKQFHLLSSTKLLQAGIQVGLQIFGGLVNLGVLGLFGGYLAGRAAGSGLLVRNTRLFFVRPSRWLAVARRYVDFPRYYALAALVNSVGLEAPALLFARYFTIDAAGYFSLTIRVLALPVSFIGQATGQVFYPEASTMRDRPAEMKALVERIATAMLLIGLPVFAFVALAGPDLFMFVFGSDWVMAGVFARFLAPWFLVTLVVTPIVTFALVKDKQRTMLLITVLEAAVRLAILLIGGTWFTAGATVQMYSFAGVALALIPLGWVLHLAGSSLWNWLWALRVYLLVSIMLLVTLAWVTRFVSPGVSIALLVAALGALGVWSLRYLRTREVR